MGNETILVVDDEQETRGAIAGMLREMGFQVLEASTGQEALDLHARHRGGIRLLLTDLIMPGMTGRMLADALGSRAPGLDVIFMSGHVNGSRPEALEPGLHYIQKPVDWERLNKIVNELLQKRKK